MDYSTLRDQAYRANLAIQSAGLVVLTWGNVSVLDDNREVLAIKPSGVDYAALSPKSMVLVEVSTGRVLEGSYKPSSDTPTHRVLYQKFDGVHSVVHTHSPFATSWAQSCTAIPAYGTTHADHWKNDIPLVRQLTPVEIETRYEEATGQSIVDSFRDRNYDPLENPGALLPFHGPFAWGPTATEAVQNAIALEAIAQMALYARQINPNLHHLPDSIAHKHYSRKHGPKAYYGQKGAHS